MKYLGPPQSGSVQSLTYSRNRGGQYTKGRNGRGGVPVRSIAGAVIAWQALTIDEQQSWNEWAKLVTDRDTLGQEKLLDGFGRFCSSWLLAALFGVALTGSPPAQFGSAVILEASLFVIAPLTVQISASADDRGSGELYGIQLDLSFPAASSGTLAPPGRRGYWRFIGGALTTGSSAAATSLVYLSSGRVFGRARVVRSDWIAGPWLRASGFVTI